MQGYHQSVINYAPFLGGASAGTYVAIDATCGNGHDTVYLADILSRARRSMPWIFSAEAL